MSNELIYGGIVLGLVTGAVLAFKNIGNTLLNKLKQKFVYSVTMYDYDELFYVFENWIAMNHQAKCKSAEAGYRKARRSIAGYYDPYPLSSSNTPETKMIYYKQEQNIFFIRYKGQWLLVAKLKKELNHATDIKDLLNYNYTVSGVYGKKIIQTLLSEITAEYNLSLKDNSVGIYIPEGGSWQLAGKRFVKPIDQVIIAKDVKKQILSDLDQFNESREWYRKLNITYKRSYLFYGPPGTGKTTIAQSIAAYLKKPIYVLNLSMFTSDLALISAFSSIPENSVLLIEDIDCSFNQRQPAAETKVTFSTLLNCLDGVIAKDDIVTVITTNHIEQLDPALIRTGRCDFKQEIPKAGAPEIQEYLELFYGTPVDCHSDVQMSMSNVQEICIRNQTNHQRALLEIQQHNN